MSEHLGLHKLDTEHQLLSRVTGQARTFQAAPDRAVAHRMSSHLSFKAWPGSLLPSSPSLTR